MSEEPEEEPEEIFPSVQEIEDTHIGDIGEGEDTIDEDIHINDEFSEEKTEVALLTFNINNKIIKTEIPKMEYGKSLKFNHVAKIFFVDRNNNLIQKAEANSENGYTIEIPEWNTRLSKKWPVGKYKIYGGGLYIEDYLDSPANNRYRKVKSTM